VIGGELNLAGKKSLLTERQLQILKLRARGYKQKEVAEYMGTTRENVAILEKRARENVERARATIKAFDSLEPISLTLPVTINLFRAPELIFGEGDKHGIKVRCNSTAIVGILRRKAGDKIVGNSIVEPIEVKLLRNGDILI